MKKQSVEVCPRCNGAGYWYKSIKPFRIDFMGEWKKHTKHKKIICPDCKGTGKETGKQSVEGVCPRCLGGKRIPIGEYSDDFSDMDCPDCNGTGKETGKQEQGDIKKILETLKAKTINECLKYQQGKIDVEEYHEVLKLFIYETEYKVRKSILSEKVKEIKGLEEEERKNTVKYIVKNIMKLKSIITSATLEEHIKDSKCNPTIYYKELANILGKASSKDRQDI